MYGYKWIDGENGIFKLDISVSVQKEIRPVFKEELDKATDGKPHPRESTNEFSEDILSKVFQDATKA